MKKRYLVLALLVLGFIPQVQAAEVSVLPSADPGTFETTIVSKSGSVSSVGAGSIIYGVDVVATTAGAYCAVYDATSAATASDAQGYFIDEISQATQHARTSSQWVAPYKLSRGLVVFPTNGKCIVVHSPN